MRLVSDTVWGMLTVLQEASNQSDDAMTGVAEVILERTRQCWRSDGSVVSTVLAPAQFSGWNTRDPNRIRVGKMDDRDPVVGRAREAWDRASQRATLTFGAVMYHDTRVTPDWIPEFTRVCQIGDLIFYARKAAP